MKRFLLISFFVFLSSLATAQAYSSAVGFRAGSPNGFTYKVFMSETDAIEAIVALRWKGIQASGLFERHAQAFDLPGLNWYYGAGAHLGIYENYRNHPFFNDDDLKESYTVIGLDGVLGLEYDISDIPITVSLDWKPEFNIIGYQGTWMGAGGLSIRYYW